jgi:hypothetical protein
MGLRGCKQLSIVFSARSQFLQAIGSVGLLVRLTISASYQQIRLVRKHWITYLVDCQKRMNVYWVESWRATRKYKIWCCHAKTPVSLGTLPAKLPPLYLSFTPTYLLRKSSVNPYILKLFK